jgi:hypothetical protein
MVGSNRGPATISNCYLRQRPEQVDRSADRWEGRKRQRRTMFMKWMEGRDRPANPASVIDFSCCGGFLRHVCSSQYDPGRELRWQPRSSRRAPGPLLDSLVGGPRATFRMSPPDRATQSIYGGCHIHTGCASWQNFVHATRAADHPWANAAVRRSPAACVLRRLQVLAFGCDRR